jgi:hypothetical protein
MVSPLPSLGWGGQTGSLQLFYKDTNPNDDLITLQIIVSKMGVRFQHKNWRVACFQTMACSDLPKV